MLEKPSDWVELGVRCHHFFDENTQTHYVTAQTNYYSFETLNSWWVKRKESYLGRLSIMKTVDIKRSIFVIVYWVRRDKMFCDPVLSLSDWSLKEREKIKSHDSASNKSNKKNHLQLSFLRSWLFGYSISSQAIFEIIWLIKKVMQYVFKWFQ